METPAEGEELGRGLQCPQGERGWGGTSGLGRGQKGETTDGERSGTGVQEPSGNRTRGGRGARAFCTHRIAVTLLEDLAGRLAGQHTGAAERGGLRGERGRVSAMRRCQAGGWEGERAGAHRVLLVAQRQAFHGRQTLHRRLVLLGRHLGLVVAGGERGAGGQHG